MKLTFREKLAIWQKERHSDGKKVTWKVEIFYSICPIIAEVKAVDPITALEAALRKTLKIHGLQDQNSYDMINEMFSKESEHFKISRR